MISIITPIYNASKFLCETARCVASQKYKDYEWILVNDGSKDDSGKICEEIAKSNPHIHVIHQENGGVSKARNIGLSIAKGDWVVFLDADDTVTDMWLQNYADAMRPEVDIIFQGAIIRTLNGETIYQLPEHKSLSITNTINLWIESFHDMGSAWSKCIRRSIIYNNQISYCEKINNFEDWIFLTRCLTEARACTTISNIGYIYNHMNSTLTGRGQKRRTAEATHCIAIEWYKTIQKLKTKSFDGYHKLIIYNSSLQLQTIIEYYRRKDTSKKKRIKILQEFSQLDYHLQTKSLAKKISNVLWIRSSPRLTDCFLRIWRLASFLE